MPFWWVLLVDKARVKTSEKDFERVGGKKRDTFLCVNKKKETEEFKKTKSKQEQNKVWIKQCRKWINKSINKTNKGCPRGVMVKARDYGIVVSEFVFQLRYYVHFWANTLGKGMNPLILPAMA